jgi:adenosylmethionine-8-amino-7-oxononanoate aminotransferase
MPARPLLDTTQALLDYDRAHIWHPYSTFTDPPPVFAVESAAGVRLRLTDGRELVDGMSSWWSAIHGYGHPRLIAALSEQAQRMSHVMFGGLTHRPAVELAARLIDISPAPLEHVFFADSGSVAVEVALKMSMQYWAARGAPAKHRLLTLRGGYHGDTFGAMAVCDPVTGMHSLFSDVLPRHVFVERPSVRFGAAFDPAAMAPLETALRAHHAELAAVIVEPVVQGAGGMWFYHPGYLQALRQLCDELGVLLIFDEIATGFGRTGKLFALEHADVVPDILCLGKALTGGMMTLAATVTTAEVAATISNGEPGVFMHGPTFMANPLACAVASASIDTLLDEPWARRIARIEQQLAAELAVCAEFPAVKEVRVLGAIGVVELHEPVDMYRMPQAFVDHGTWVRPFGRLVYVMPPYVIDEPDLSTLTRAIARVLENPPLVA